MSVILFFKVTKYRQAFKSRASRNTIKNPLIRQGKPTLALLANSQNPGAFCLSFVLHAQTSCLILKAIPDPDFRFFSNAKALYLSLCL
jgi:hypothetical protein